jgi:hypothetical protein
MNLEDKERLLDLLSESYSATRAILEGADPEMQVYADSGWRIRDIIGHIAVWDRQSAKSIRAYQSGREYSILDLSEHDFNQQSVLELKDLTSDEVFKESEQAREDFKESVEDLPPSQFSGDFLYPWGDERGSIALLVEYMVEHDAEHRQEIVQAIQALDKD